MKSQLSIIIATYNSGQHLLKCLESIRSQQFKSIEIVVIDACSTDNTLEIIKSFEHENLVWISEPDRGIYDALNKGVKTATGTWLYFLGSDDYLLPGFSDLALKLENPKAIYYGNTEPYYLGNSKPTYQIITGEFSSYGLTKYCLNHQSIIYPSAVFKHYQYELKYKVFADYALNLKLWGDRRFPKIYFQIPIVKYNMSGFSSLTKDHQFTKDKPSIIKKHMGWLIYLKYSFRMYKKRRRNETDFE